jgi:hypothetical protein
MWYVYLMDKPQAIKADPCQTIGVWLWLGRPYTDVYGSIGMIVSTSYHPLPRIIGADWPLRLQRF